MQSLVDSENVEEVYLASAGSGMEYPPSRDVSLKDILLGCEVEDQDYAVLLEDVVGDECFSRPVRCFEG
ncbi:MAG: hypothetical protein ABEJ99_03610 [Candidatus Nanohaloarchaea archaeon]